MFGKSTSEPPPRSQVEHWEIGFPSLGRENARKFGLAVMDAALADTSVDLLVLMNPSTLPALSTWSHDREWMARELRDDNLGNVHSLHRYALALLAQRLDTCSSDFLAFKEAARMLDDVGLFDRDGEKWSASPLVREMFPSIDARADSLAQRHAALTWRPEPNGSAPVISEETIAALRIS